MRRLAFLLSFLSLGSSTVLSGAEERGVRLKDLVTIEGVRSNQLIGYGLVVGLNGTGDRQQTVFSVQSLTNLLQRMGVSVAPGSITVKNTASVLVTATLPAFAQPGATLDATVSSIGDASNLQGGLLVLTTLRGINGQVYATSQGPVVTGGFVAGRGGNAQTVNHPTVGRIPNGVSVERVAPSVAIGKTVRLQLRQADFTTAARVAEVVNRHFTEEDDEKNTVARAENSALVSVLVPASFATRSIEFISELERLSVQPDRIARVVVNERTGTVVLGKEVRIAPVAVMHGNLTVEVQTINTATDPVPLSSPAVVTNTTVAAKDDKTRNVVLKDGATVEELVKALAAIGSTTRDVIAILQNLRAAGALDAETGCDLMSPLKLTSSIAGLPLDGTAATKGKASKLHQAAQSFEALMLGEMMKSVRESSSSGWLGSGGEDSSTDSATEMAESHFAQALAQSGGLGLAKMVEQTVGQQSGVQKK